MNKNYQEKKPNFLRYMVLKYLQENPNEKPVDIYERMGMDKHSYNSYIREFKNSSPESWHLWIKGLRTTSEKFYKEAETFFSS